MDALLSGRTGHAVASPTVPGTEGKRLAVGRRFLKGGAMALMRVFYEFWQMECCGTPFAVGDRVGWPLVIVGRDDIDSGDWAEELRTHGALSRVEKHGGPAHETVGRVRSIDLVHQDHAERAPGAHTLEPVPGTRALTPVDACPKWFRQEEPRTEAGLRRARRTTGVLVTLDVADAAPPEPRDRP
ncbi:DUF6578 domain-containing protein [Streptomyces sp. NPDC005209]|uniref:DUF6578 domain-containing protein n=1 Tax=Streptomyces sp. NPDC005209 TaxID=3156715 RepID=UPI0033A1D744